jgi:hypothetical protein
VRFATVAAHTMKERTLEGFGPRLAELRKVRGLTQTELGDQVASPTA